MTGPQNVSGLMDQIHELKTQLADAEKRGAVKALRRWADHVEGGADVTAETAAADLRDWADRLTAGESL